MTRGKHDLLLVLAMAVSGVLLVVHQRVTREPSPAAAQAAGEPVLFSQVCSLLDPESEGTELLPAHLLVLDGSAHDASREERFAPARLAVHVPAIVTTRVSAR